MPYDWRLSLLVDNPALRCGDAQMLLAEEQNAIIHLATYGGNDFAAAFGRFPLRWRSRRKIREAALADAALSLLPTVV